MKKADFEKLADSRMKEAGILLPAGEADGAYYLAGYAVECALKACIIRKLMTSDIWPDKSFSENCYKHDLTLLLKLANLDDDMNRSGPVNKYWVKVKDWSKQSRYKHGKLLAEVALFYAAVIDATDGVLQWFKSRW